MIVYYFIEQNSVEFLIIVGLTTFLTLWTAFCSFICCYRVVRKYRNRKSNNEVINETFHDEDRLSLVLSPEYASSSINMSQEATDNNANDSLETTGENIFNMEDGDPQEVYNSPLINSKVETELLSHAPTAYSDHSIDTEPLSHGQSPTVSIVNNCSSGVVSQNVFLNEKAREALSNISTGLGKFVACYNLHGYKNVQDKPKIAM